MVDGETYGCVKSFCCLGDTHDGDGGAVLAATARSISDLKPSNTSPPSSTSQSRHVSFRRYGSLY